MSLADFQADDSLSSPIRILVVEDNIETAGMIRHLLEHNGYQVVEINSGAAALELIEAVERGEQEPFEVALLDIMMPQVNGYQVCQEIRQTEQLGYIPIIMVTALNSTGDMVRGLDLGADDYLVKPFNSRELLARVRAALRIRDVDRSMRRRNWQLAMVNSFNDAIGESLDADEVLRAGLDHLLQQLDLAYAATFTLNRNSGDIAQILFYDGKKWLEQSIADPKELAQGSNTESWEERHIYQLALDAITSGRLRLQTPAYGWPPLPAPMRSKKREINMLGGEGWRACVPLKTKPLNRLESDRTEIDPSETTRAQITQPSGRVLGALVVGAAADKPIIDPDLLTAIGNQIGQALEKSHFYQQARGRSEELTALYKISQAVNSILDLNIILTTALEGIGQIVPVEAGSLLLLDNKNGQLTFVRTLRKEDDPLLSCKMDVGQGIVGQAVQNKQPIIVNDVRAHPHFHSEFDEMTGFATRSAMCVPLHVRDEVIGVIELLNKHNGPFNERDIELVSSMAASVAIAVENGRLFHDLSAAYDNLEHSRQTILASRNRLQALFDSISDIIYVVDDKYHIAAVNAALGRWLIQQHDPPSIRIEGLPDSVEGQICYQTLYGREAPCQGCQMAKALQTGEHVLWTDHRRRPDGSREEWEMSAYPIQGARQEIRQGIVLARDVTEQRMLEASLSQAEKLASVGQLAAGLAHEINNPLTAIVANVELLLMDTLPDNDDYESLDLIKQASDRAVRVVRNLLDFSRQEQYEFEPSDINATLHAALDLVRHQFRMAEVKVIENLAPETLTALVSRDHLQSVWLNLLLNARDAITQHIEEVDEPCVWVSSRQQENGFLEVTIRDNGVGIPPEQTNRIFEPFFTTKDPGKGTGLGLSTSYHVIKQHGGEINVDSQVGAGTTFTVLLPGVAR